MIICSCEGITDKQIKAAIRCGAKNLDQIGRSLGCGLGCGDCAASVKKLLKTSKQAAHSSSPQRSQPDSHPTSK